MRYFFSFILLFCVVEVFFLQNSLFGQISQITTPSLDTNTHDRKPKQEENPTLSKLVQLLAKATSLKIPADIVLDEQGAELSVSTVGQKEIIDSLNNVLEETKKCYEALQQIMAEKGVLYFLFQSAEVGFANIEEVKILEKFSQNMPELKRYLNGELREYYNNFLFTDVNNDTSVVMSAIEFDSKWINCERYYTNFGVLRNSHIGKKIIMDKSDFVDLLNWQENIRELTIFLDKHPEYTGRADKLAKIADMNFLLEHNLLDNLELIPIRGFTEQEKIDRTIRRDITLPQTCNPLYHHINKTLLTYRAVATIVYSKSGEPENVLYKGGRFFLNGRSHFRPIALPPKSKGTIEFSLYYYCQESCKMPLDKIGAGVSIETITGKQEETATFIVPFETNTITTKFGTPTIVKVDTHMPPNSSSRITAVKPQVIQNIKGNILEVDAIMGFGKDTSNRNQRHPRRRTAEPNPLNVLTIEIPFFIEGSTYLGMTQEYDKPRVAMGIENLGSAKVFYEKGKYESKYQTQASQKELNQWLNKLANNEILIDALKEKILYLSVRGYAGAEGRDDISLSQKRGEEAFNQTKSFLLNVFKGANTDEIIIWSGGTHPDSKDSDKEAIGKKHRYVEVKLEWNR